MNHVLVTGATGAIGPVLLRRLARDGCHVRMLMHRNPSDALPLGVETIPGDLRDPASLRVAVHKIDTIFHLAALLHVNDPPPTLRADYWRINVDGTRNLVAAAGAAGVARLIFFSTINVYGPSQPGQVFNETSPLHPESWYAQTKLEAERLALSAMPSVILRPAAVYGPRLKGNYARLLDALRRRRFVMVGNGSNRRTLVHVEDLCTAALLAAMHPDAVGQVYNVSDGRLHTLREIIAAMCAALGKKPPKFYVPVAVAQLLLGSTENLLRFARKTKPVRRAMLDKFTEDVAVSSAKIQAQLDYQPHYDLASGWQHVVRV